MLTKDPNSRIALDDVAAHVWLRGPTLAPRERTRYAAIESTRPNSWRPSVWATIGVAVALADLLLVVEAVAVAVAVPAVVHVVLG